MTLHFTQDLLGGRSLTGGDSLAPTLLRRSSPAVRGRQRLGGPVQLGEPAQSPRYLDTVRGVGVKLVEPTDIS